MRAGNGPGTAFLVKVVEPTGSETHLFGTIAGVEVRCVFRERVAARPGDTLQLAIDPANLHVFDAATGARLVKAPAHAPAIDIVARMREIASGGSRSDRRLAAEILADPDFATRAPIAQLAERSEVSQPTVTRFCRALGCTGLRDFKVLLAQAIATTGRYMNPPRQSGSPMARPGPTLWI